MRGPWWGSAHRISSGAPARCIPAARRTSAGPRAIRISPPLGGRPRGSHDLTGDSVPDSPGDLHVPDLAHRKSGGALTGVGIRPPTRSAPSPSVHPRHPRARIAAPPRPTNPEPKQQGGVDPHVPDLAHRKSGGALTGVWGLGQSGPDRLDSDPEKSSADGREANKMLKVQPAACNSNRTDEQVWPKIVSPTPR